MSDPIMAAIEAVSLAASISSTFVSVVECFEYVELGRRFGKDFDKSQARSEALKLQIKRWGIATGALPDPNTKQHRIVKVDGDTAKVADRLLNNTLGDTKELEKKSRRYSDPPASASKVIKSEQELCRIGVEEIQDGQPKAVMELLHEVSKANNDIILEQAIQEVINSRAPGHSWERTEVDDSVKLEQGDRIAIGFTAQAPGE
ncbi:small s [Trichoderma arundinaceum]|uniref:Small s n=1 Tax=Trichoderma arundinaceum TaxID=490622 RepID=A0A395NQ84_TRIAR|nr:small s [Trichoderma arundinaceum]